MMHCSFQRYGVGKVWTVVVILFQLVMVANANFPANDYGDTFPSNSTSYEMAVLSGWIYDTSDTNSTTVNNYTTHFVTEDDTREVTILTTSASSEPKLIVLFRGFNQSRSRDYLDNLDIRREALGPEGETVDASIQDKNIFGYVTDYEVTIHSKLNNALFANNLYTDLTNVLDGLSSNFSDTVYFTGHGVGGANAQVMGTYYAHRHNNTNVNVITFGQPLVGTYGYKVWANAIPNLNSWRFVYSRDVFARGPNLQFYHAGHLMWKTRDGPVEAYYRQDGEETLDYAGVPFSWSLGTCLTCGTEGTSDHDTSKYVSWLKSAVLNESPTENYWATSFQANETTTKNGVRNKSYSAVTTTLLVVASCSLLGYNL